MKYLFAVAISAFVTLGLSSCAKETCYTCEHPSTSCTVDVCDGAYNQSGGTNCGNFSTGNSGAKNEDLKNSLEAAGYNCTAK